jgi:hypothetical protein
VNSIEIILRALERTLEYADVRGQEPKLEVFAQKLADTYASELKLQAEDARQKATELAGRQP